VSAPTIAFLFPGQGSQVIGMGKELAQRYAVAKQTFEEADEVLDYRVSQLCFAGPEDQLKLTEITQPAILTVSVAVMRVLQEQGMVPAFVAGHSLGEYSANVCAGTLSFADAVRTVRSRGSYMQMAVPLGKGSMAAILGLSIEAVEAICREVGNGEVVSPANINSPEQIVISGNAGAVERAADLAKERGAKRAIMLQVSAPFHCALMQPAQNELAEDLKKLEFQDPAFPIAMNINGELANSGEVERDALIRQVTGAVQWVKCVQTLISSGADTFIEVGPGRVLTGLMRQIDRSKTALNVEDAASLQKTRAALESKNS